MKTKSFGTARKPMRIDLLKTKLQQLWVFSEGAISKPIDFGYQNVSREPRCRKQFIVRRLEFIDRERREYWTL